MSQEEAEEVLTDHRGGQASGLIALADGWPAVIGLAAMTDEVELPDEGLPEALYDYFAEELYQAADPELRWSLSQLSLSSSVAPEVAEAVLGGDAERALVEGHRLGFLVPSEHGVFEIHPLLRAFLEEKFRELAGDRAPAIVELVVRTHLEREEWDDAFSIVERFFDADLLVEVVETALPQVLLEARLPTLARWVECAAEHEVDAPVFDLAEGELAFRAGDRTRSEALGLQAARRFDEAPCARVAVVRARRAPAPTWHTKTRSPSSTTIKLTRRPGRRSTFGSRCGASSLRTRPSNEMPTARSRSSRRTRRSLLTT